MFVYWTSIVHLRGGALEETRQSDFQIQGGRKLSLGEYSLSLVFGNGFAGARGKL